MTSRRSFLKFLGLAPAAPLAVKASEKFAETAKALDIGPAPALPVDEPVRVYSSRETPEDWDGCTISTFYSAPVYIAPRRQK